MLYRLPFLFSASYYLFVLIIKVITLFREQKLLTSHDLFYNISQTVLSNLTLFFFIYALSCLFFFKRKIYFYTAKNKRYTIILAAIFTVIYFILDYLLFELNSVLLLPHLANIIQSDDYHNVAYFYQLSNLLLSIICYIGLAVVLPVSLFLLVKCCKSFFDIPLINHIAPSSALKDTNQLNSHTSTRDYHLLYSIIFSSFCCGAINGFIWNIYFSLLLIVEGIKGIIFEYYNCIFYFALISIIIDYFLLFFISKKNIVQTYNGLPVIGLLTASVMTLILFGISALIVSFLLLPFVFTFQSALLFGIWVVICYIMLYYLSRFSIRRFFA